MNPAYPEGPDKSGVPGGRVGSAVPAAVRRGSQADSKRRRYPYGVAIMGLHRSYDGDEVSSSVPPSHDPRWQAWVDTGAHIDHVDMVARRDGRAARADQSAPRLAHIRDLRRAESAEAGRRRRLRNRAQTARRGPVARHGSEGRRREAGQLPDPGIPRRIPVATPSSLALLPVREKGANPAARVYEIARSAGAKAPLPIGGRG